MSVRQLSGRWQSRGILTSPIPNDPRAHLAIGEEYRHGNRFRQPRTFDFPAQKVLRVFVLRFACPQSPQIGCTTKNAIGGRLSACLVVIPSDVDPHPLSQQKYRASPTTITRLCQCSYFRHCVLLGWLLNLPPHSHRDAYEIVASVLLIPCSIHRSSSPSQKRDRYPRRLR